MTDESLLIHFVASFGMADDLTALDVIPTALTTDKRSLLGFPKWRPAAIETERKYLEELYKYIPGPFPSLYEQLILKFRWLDVYLDDELQLLANPPGTSLQGLADRILADRLLVSVLFPHRLIPFAKAGDSYDPICFDLSQKIADSDSRIVRVEHESVLCDEKVGEVWTVYDSFRTLVNSFVV